jgi:hypothetical protein
MAGLTRLAPDASPHAAHSVYTLDAARAGEAQPLGRNYQISTTIPSFNLISTIAGLSLGFNTI